MRRLSVIVAMRSTATGGRTFSAPTTPRSSTNAIAPQAINAERRRAGQIAPTAVQEIGDLSIVSGLDEYDAGDFYLVPKNGLLKIGSPGEFLFYKKSRKIDWKVADLERAFPPDAVFRDGKWEKGARLLPKID